MTREEGYELLYWKFAQQRITLQVVLKVIVIGGTKVSIIHAVLLMLSAHSKQDQS